MDFKIKKWTNKTVISIGLGMTIGFIIVELFNDPINWIKPIISGAITTALLWVFRLVVADKKSK